MLPPDVLAGLTQVDDEVYLVPADAPGATHAMLVVDGDTMLVDAGISDAWAKKLAPHVDVCVLTHCHAEPARAASRFRHVWAPRAEARALRSAADYVETYGIASRDRTTVERHLQAVGWSPLAPERSYRPGGVLDLGKTRWELHAAPGHSPGLTLLLEPTRHYLFASDLDGGDDALYGYPTADVDALVETFEKLATVDVAVLMGAREAPRKRGIRQMLRDKAAGIKDRDLRIVGLLQNPRTLEELVELAPLTGKAAIATPMGRYVERVMVEKHLGRLIERDHAMARQDGRFMRVE